MSKKNVKNQSVKNVANNAKVSNNAVEATKVAPNYEVEEMLADDELLDGIITRADFSKALREVLRKTQTLSQTLKVFGGLLSMPLTIKGNVFTFGQLLEKTMGNVIVKGRINPKMFLAAWSIKNDVGAPMVYRNLPLKVMSEDKTDKGAKHDDLRVYKRNTDYKDTDEQCWEPLSQFGKSCIDEYRWSANIIIKGLVQMAFPNYYENQARKSRNAWNALTEVYRFESRFNKGTEKNPAIKVDKKNVTC